MITLRRALLTTAAFATAFFIAAAPTEGNWKFPAVVALLAFGGYFYAKHLIDETERLDAQRTRECREQWMASFARRRAMRGAR